MRPEDALAGDIEAALAPVLEDLALGLDVFVRGQAAVLRLGVPGADRLAVLALGNEDVDVDGVARLAVRGSSRSIRQCGAGPDPASHSLG